MGRRSINTTKSGKYMNPTDQARKEARKKELKKNKKQRQMVRAAVLKNKDPAQILEEMEKIDEMEYNVLQPSPLNEKVLRDKRKKLKETFERVMRLYQAEEPELWSDLKRKEIEYEKKRLKKQQYYESVKHAQSVQVDEIPLPSATQTPPTAGTLAFGGGGRLPPPPSALSLPPFAPGAPPSALRRPLENILKLADTPEAIEAKDRSGVPFGPPPNLMKMPELDTDAEDEPVTLKKYIPKNKKKSVSKPNTLQQRMLAISGQNIDDFMKEMESVHKKKEKERKAAKRKHSDRSDDDDDDENDDNEDGKSFKAHDDDDDDDDDSPRLDRYSDSDEDNSESDNEEEEVRKEKDRPPLTMGKPITPASNMPPVIIPLPPAPSGVPPHMPVPPMHPVTGIAPPMMYRPPPLRPPGITAYGIRMPPGPPTGPRPRPPGINMPPRMGIRMPPGPPPGLPPRMAQHKNAQQNLQQQQLLLKDASKGVTTITAKPQIRNLSADVTRFVPSALRVKREETKKSKPTKTYTPEQSNQSVEASKAATKDDAYLQFMNEMQGLL